MHWKGCEIAVYPQIRSVSGCLVEKEVNLELALSLLFDEYE